ncbi:hypothetical protein HMPREF3150_02132 [Pseudomonas aeruginosa]|nr:hypothetical protein HMPREF3150_02132 [Pseudomonas aeruginosa]
MLSWRCTPIEASGSSSIFDFDGHPEHLHYRLDRLIAVALVALSILVWLSLRSACGAL